MFPFTPALPAPSLPGLPGQSFPQPAWTTGSSPVVTKEWMGLLNTNSVEDLQ